MAIVRTFTDCPRGEIRALKHCSRVLQGNPWNDPAERNLYVYLPPGYSESGSAYTALWDLAAFTNAGPGHIAWRNHGENLPDRLNRLIHEGKMPPVVMIFPDCYTSLGGNQYVNSGSVGCYADYLVEELLPFVTQQLNVLDDRYGRGVFGKSSGGYGALRLAMHYPQCWGAVAAHAPDVGFDLVYRPEFPVAANTLNACGGDIHQFLSRFWRNKKPGSADYATLMTLAMAASYDPDPDNADRIRLPFDLQYCRLDPDRWARWLEHDPLNMLTGHSEALQTLHALYLDVGDRDQYNIHYGVRLFSRTLEKLGIHHHFEEFEGTHSGMDWRLDISLPFIANALAGTQASAKQD